MKLSNFLICEPEVRTLIRILILLLIFVSSTYGCCSEMALSFEIHEWGVFIKGYNCNNTSVLTESPPKIYARKPIIYFHSNQNISNINLVINKIFNTNTIPNATINSSKIFWTFDIINNSIVINNGSNYPYIFYEGEITYYNNIFAEIIDENVINIKEKLFSLYNGRNITYTIKNNENYTISNVFLLYGRMGKPGNLKDDFFECIFFDELKKGEEKTIINIDEKYKVNISETIEILFNSLIHNGLTVSEANELIDNWINWWFYPTNFGTFTRLLYFNPLSVYNKLLPLEISYKPDNISRVGIFTITDLPINGGFDWNLTENLNLTVSASTDKMSYGKNENVTIFLMATNTGNENITLSFSSSQVADFNILNEEDERVYGWSYDRAFLDVLTNITIPVGETVEFLNATWDQKDNNGNSLPAGNYIVKGELQTNPELLSNTVTIILQGEDIQTPGFGMILILLSLILILLWGRRK